MTRVWRALTSQTRSVQGMLALVAVAAIVCAVTVLATVDGPLQWVIVAEVAAMTAANVVAAVKLAPTRRPTIRP